MTQLEKVLNELTELYKLWFYTISKRNPLFWVSRQAKKYDSFLCRFYSTLRYTKSYSHVVWENATPKQRIAIVILFDQIPRQIFRGTCDMYAYDDLALNYAKQINYRLTPFELMYILMPYQHSESLDNHRLGMKRLQRYKKIYKNKLMERLEKAFKEHSDVIRRYHEYPKRRLDCGYTIETLPYELREYILQSNHPYI